MGQEQALQHLCLELGHKRCSSELTVLIALFRRRKGHLPRRGKGKEAELRRCCLLPERAGCSKPKEPETDTQSVPITSSPSKEQDGEQIRDSSHSPVFRLMVWTMTKPELSSLGCDWVSVQVCPIRLDTFLSIFPLPLQQSTLFPHAAALQYVEEILFSFPFHEITDDN